MKHVSPSRTTPGRNERNESSAPPARTHRQRNSHDRLRMIYVDDSGSVDQGLIVYGWLGSTRSDDGTHCEPSLNCATSCSETTRSRR